MNAAKGKRGSVARADLLRHLAHKRHAGLALDDSSQGWWGYLPLPLAQENLPDAHLPTLPVPSNMSASPATKLRAQLTTQWAVTQHTTTNPDETAKPPPLLAAAPLTETDAQAQAVAPLFAHHALLPWARLLPQLLKPIRQSQPSGLDVDRWVVQWAQRERSKPWPRHSIARLPGKLIVALDFDPRLWPYRSDMHQLCRHLLGLCGHSGVSLRVMSHGPLGGWTDWVAGQDLSRASTLQPQPWAVLPPGPPVLIVSDLGAHSPNASVQQQWQTFLAGFNRAKLRPWVLCPVGADQQNLPVFTQILSLRWSPDAPMRYARAANRATDTTAAPPAGLAELLAMIATTRRSDPPLLRALRAINPHQPRNAGLEAAAWNHPSMQAGPVAMPNAQASAPHLARFAQQPAQLQGSVHSLRQQHHSHFRAALNHEENLHWHAHASAAAQQSPVAQALIAKALAFGAQLVGTLQQDPQAEGAERFNQLAKQWLWRANADLVQSQPALFQTLAKAVYAPELAQGQSPTIPHWVDASDWIGNPADLRLHSYWLVHDALSGCLLLQAQPPKSRQSPLSVSIDLSGVTVQLASGIARTLIRPAGQTITLARADDLDVGPIQLITANTHLTLNRVERPRWLESWGRNAEGLFATVPYPWGKNHALIPDVVDRIVQGNLPEPGYELSFELTVERDNEVGLDLKLDRLGPIATLNVNAATQSLRYLPPGQFLMGSPADEHQREDDEGPQHWVTLTEGLWLADTACTQALWLAVMGGKNPSHFTGDNELPVEQVSWDDVQVFLSKLQAYLPAGVQAVLPTEAQWEYACRAGSRAGASTPFSFGQDITPEQVNYDGNYPYRSAIKGVYRNKTVPVKALPANAWGLYQMHGNVWEWCADTMRTYTVDAETNPRGATGKDAGDFAVRGGSWFARARHARSAQRSGGQRGDRLNYLGFRFALRFTAQGAGGPGPEGSPNFGRSPSSPRDGAAPGAVAPDFKKSGSVMGALRNAFTNNKKNPKNE